jgi:hypothetical protein
MKPSLQGSTLGRQEDAAGAVLGWPMLHEMNDLVSIDRQLAGSPCFRLAAFI